MTISDVLSQIDSEISRLQQARQLIAGSNLGNVRATPKPARKKRTISAAGRARIAAAQRARWAKRKKAAQ
jgi:hypothetical protein